MLQFISAIPFLFFGIGIFAVFFGAFAWGRGFLALKIFPFVPQKKAPWGLAEILLLIIVYLGTSVCVGSVIFMLAPSQNETEIAEPAKAAMIQVDKEQLKTDNELRNEHPLTFLLAQKKSRFLVIGICFLAAVIIAPISEEFFFRVVIQQGIDAMFRNRRAKQRQHDPLQNRPRNRQYLSPRYWPLGTAPVLITALLFAIIHFRGSSESESLIAEYEVNMMFLNMIGLCVVNSMVCVVMIFLMRTLYADLSWADLGLQRFDKLGTDFFGAMIALAAVLIPVFFIQAGVKNLFPNSVALDPLPLFPIALVLGAVFYRTKRLAPAVFFHMGLNAFSFVMVLISQMLNGL